MPAKNTLAAGSTATTSPHTSNLLTRKPFTMPAIAATAQDFGSGRPAIKEGQYVLLEFGLSQITVHDPLRKSPSECNKLGVILYSYGFSSWDKEFSMDKAADSGQVSKDMWFLFLSIKHTKEQSECCVCGKVFPRSKKKTRDDDHLRMTENHLAEHYAVKK
jgi:hypothetical protein